MSEELLELALTLARGLSGPGRPKSVELRRAISSAYYAVFHALCSLSAFELVGNKPWRFFTPVYRTVDHRTARNVLNDLRRGDSGSAIAGIALTFSQLQDARYDADYSPEPFKFNRSGTIELVEAGRRTVSLLNALNSDQKLMLAIRLVTRPR